MRPQQNRYTAKPNVILYNRLNSEQIAGDLVNEDEIEGKQFYVMRVNGRLLKLAKDAYTTKKVFAQR